MFIKKEYFNRYLIVCEAVKACILGNRYTNEIGSLILKFIQESPSDEYYTIFNVIGTYFSKGRTINDIESLILYLARKNAENLNCVSNIFSYTIQTFVSMGISINDIDSFKVLISELIKINPNNQCYVQKIITTNLSYFSKPNISYYKINELILYLAKENAENLECVSSIIHKVVLFYFTNKTDKGIIMHLIFGFMQGNLKDPKYVFTIVNATVQAYIKKGKSTIEVVNLISDLIEKNPNHTINIVGAAVQTYILRGKENEIRELISELIEKNPNHTISIVNGTVQASLLLRETTREAITIFDNCKLALEVLKSSKQTDKIKPIFPLIISKYLMDILINNKRIERHIESTLLSEYNYFTGSEIGNLNEIKSENLLVLHNLVPEDQLDTIYFNKI